MPSFDALCADLEKLEKAFSSVRPMKPPGPGFSEDLLVLAEFAFAAKLAKSVTPALFERSAKLGAATVCSFGIPPKMFASVLGFAVFALLPPPKIELCVLVAFPKPENVELPNIEVPPPMVLAVELVVLPKIDLVVVSLPAEDLSSKIELEPEPKTGFPPNIDPLPALLAIPPKIVFGLSLSDVVESAALIKELAALPKIEGVCPKMGFLSGKVKEIVIFLAKGPKFIACLINDPLYNT